MDIMGMSVVNPSGNSFEDIVDVTSNQDQIVSNYLGIHLIPQSVNLANSQPSNPSLVPRHLPSALASPDSDKWEHAMVSE